MKLSKLYLFDKEQLAYKQINLIKIVLFLAGCLAAIVFLSSFIIRYSDKEAKTVYVQGEKEIVIKNNREFTKAKLIEEIKKYNFRYPEIIYAQAAIESAGFSSPVFKSNHNLFGLREAKQRVTTAQGTDSNHAFYHDWQSSVADRAIYEASYLRTLNSRGAYMQYLNRNYAEANDYTKTLEEFIKKNKIKTLFK